MTVCLHTLFEEQAELHPDLPALKFLDKEISYKELNERSTQLANHLLSKGVKTGDNVCIFIKRSFEMMIGILGILKSGAAYVPIDPKTPKERINFLLDDADCSLLVTNSGLFGEMNCEQKIVLLDMDNDIIATHSTDEPGCNISDQDIAVILYTSGSTGYPKGVLLSHSALANRFLWGREEYKHSTEDIVLQHASYTFDFSLFEMFTALANGGKLVLARPDFHYESFYLTELIQREGITKMGSSPSLLNAYIHLPVFEKTISLKQVFLGGEILHYNLQETFFKKSSAELINIYGPTETSISVLHWTCRRGDKEKVIPIGFPVANMKIYLLDENQEPVPDGTPGEIYISGPGVGSGYHNRPELTAKHFLRDPFSPGKETLMYRTGDFGKKRPDGAIQFLGRKDHQLKIRGLRVEIEEIEHHIISHKSVSDCVVSDIENKNGELKLVAYVIPTPGSKLDSNEISKHLLRVLPDYMVPGMFLEITKFPLSPHGKIDRKSLPYPDDVRLLSGVAYCPPVNKIQQKLVQIWEKVFELKPIGITDSFYSIGGDSLTAIKIHTLMESEMGCTLPLSAFANANTIQEQADIILSNSKLKSSSKLIQLRSTGEKAPIVFAGPAQSIGITLSRNLLKYLSPDHPFLTILPFEKDDDNIPDSIEEIAHYYVQLLLDQYPSNDYIIGGFSMGGLIAYEMAIILRNKGIGINSLILIDTPHSKILGNEYSFSIKKAIFYYLKKIVKGNNKERKDIFKYLLANKSKANLDFFKKEKTHPFLQRLETFLNLSSKKKDVQKKRKNYSLAVRYNLRPDYKGNVLLIIANIDDHSPSYSNQLLLRYKKNNVRKWEDDILGELSVYEVPGTHGSMMKEPIVKIVANIINDQIWQKS